MSRVAIVQSNYLPWRGYFDLIDSVDTFVIFDDVQFTKRDWRNRNKIRGQQGFKWITVPTDYSQKNFVAIDEVKIKYSVDWISDHLKWIQHAYKEHPNFPSVFGELREILSQNHTYLSELNSALISWVCGLLNIKTKIIQARPLSAMGKKTDRLLDICLKLDASDYIAGPRSLDYLEEEKFHERGINILIKSYDYLPYDQGAEEFSILDLLFLGADKSLWKSQAPDLVLENSKKLVRSLELLRPECLQ